jgi:hypothetical protein
MMKNGREESRPYQIKGRLIMNSNKRIIAAIELVLIFPAAVFLTAVILRNLQPLQYEPAHTALMIVTWYAVRGWTLWVLLIGLPLTALFSGGITLIWNWSERKTTSKVRWDGATIIIAAETLAAGVILAEVAVHMLMN